MCIFICVTCGVRGDSYNKECFISGHIINIFITYCTYCKNYKDEIQAYYPLDKCGQDPQTVAKVTRLNKDFLKSEPYNFEYCEACINSIESDEFIKEPAI